MYYPEQVVDEVSRANDIVDLVGQYVKLKRSGNRYTGLCPFHNEKTPSFSVSGDSQLYYCFGCGAGGNIYTFLMEYENLTFAEAIKYLADRASITLPEDNGQADRSQDLKRKQMLEANKMAATYYHYLLKNDVGKMGMEYFKKRGLSDETIRNFGLGFAPAASNALYRYLKKKNFSDEILKDSGLVKIDEKGAYDRFWNRVMFPIMDVNNRVIGFGGRVLGDGLPKYINSPETKLFDKSRNLYGLHAAKKSRKDFFLLCEGYMDVISLHQAGFTNAVAALGTAFTPQHAMLIKRYVKKVICTFDSDGAGVKAALRAIPILQEAGLQVRILNMTPYKDPDEFIKNLGAEAYEERIKEAKNSFLFEISILRKEFNFQDPAQLTAFQNETARRLLRFEDEMERNNYVDAVAGEYGMNSAELRRKVNQMGAGIVPASSGYDYSALNEDHEREEAAARRLEREKKKREDKADVKAQKMLLAWITRYPSVYGQINQLVTPSAFTDETCAKLCKLIYARLDKGESISPAELLNYFINDEGDYASISGIFHMNLLSTEEKAEQERILTDLVRKVKSDSIRIAGRSTQDMAAFQKMVEDQKKLRTLKIRL